MQLACTTCGNTEVMALRPPSNPLVHAGIVIQRGEAGEMWCRPCWLRKFGARQPDLFGMVP